MVTLNRIYTKTGDKGETALGDGTRRSKHDLRIHAYGTVDETNAAIGLARLHAKGELDVMLGRIQNDLFDLGADLATPRRRPPRRGSPSNRRRRRSAGWNAKSTLMNEALKPLDSFVLPGGTPAAAYLHLARTIARRAERLMVELAQAEKVSPVAIRYINRLSDHLFVASRLANDGGAKDVLWVPGANR